MVNKQDNFPKALAIIDPYSPHWKGFTLILYYNCYMTQIKKCLQMHQNTDKKDGLLWPLLLILCIWDI